MSRGLDSRTQNILQNANGNEKNEYLQNFHFKPEHPSSTNWSFRPSLGQLVRKPTSSNGLIEDNVSSPYHYSMEYCPQGDSIHDYQQQTSSLPHTGFNRISLLPQNLYHNDGNIYEATSHTENSSLSKQNLYQGRALYETHRKISPKYPDKVTQLANAMLLHQPLPQLDISQRYLEPRSMAKTQTIENLQHQSQIQQLPPLLNSRMISPSPLPGYHTPISQPFRQYNYTSRSQSASVISSPSFGTLSSSPTSRINFRQQRSRLIEPSQCESYDQIFNDNKVSRFLEAHSCPNVVSSPNAQGFVLKNSPPMAQGIQLISPFELSDKIRQVFPYDLFNPVQSRCFSKIYKTSDNLIVSAPTGSGKTVLLELAICRLVENFPSEQFKIIYLAPTKSLCSQRLQDWQKKFCHLNLSCAELTGDTNQFEMTRVRNASIIVTTPEKWDSITRKLSDHHRLVQMVKLFLIDEVHILKDIRGATLEAVVSRMKAIGARIRFIALSATVPNPEDIAFWLGKDHSNQYLPAHQENFGEDFRPVKLQKHVHGYDSTLNDYAFDKFLDSKLTSLLQKYTQKKPTMIFCFTRKSCESTAFILSEWWSKQEITDRTWPEPFQRLTVGHAELQKVVICGVAFHHAGLDAQDRKAIETGFLNGSINVICCTSTLAVGVNLPCHTVVLKGTVGFQDGALHEYSDLEVMQMLGRAGRPQFDDSAISIIMTRSEKSKHYKHMISGQDVLESTLHLNLIEHLNSEISLGSVRDLNQARTWITKTFLSVRMRKNPRHYKITDITEGGDTDERLKKVCERDITLLQAHNLVTKGENFICTEYGEAMCKYMVQFETMKILLSIPRQASIEQILTIVCQAIEFRDLRMKPQERSCFKKLNKSPFVKFPVHETLSTSAHKAFLVIQIQLGGIQFPDEKDFGVFRRQFSIDKNIIFERVHRLVRCIIDCKIFDCDAVSTRHAFDLARSLSSEYWENSNLQLRQVSQIGPVAHRKLCNCNVNTVEKFAALDTASIERILSKNPPFGKKMKDILENFPLLNISARVNEKIDVNPQGKPQIDVKALLSYKNNQIPIWNGKKPAVIFMAETSRGVLSYIWRGNIANLCKGFELNFKVTLSRVEEESKCWIACEEIVGTAKCFLLRHNIPATKFPPPSPESEDKGMYGFEKNTTSNSDEFGIDELEDEEILAVAKSVEKPTNEYDPDNFSDIDIDMFDESRRPIISNITGNQLNRYSKKTIESTQMKNGKWTCQHDCRDGGLRKNGQKCKHRCCHEGIDKPSKLKQSVCQESSQHKTQDESTSNQLKMIYNTIKPDGNTCFSFEPIKRGTELNSKKSDKLKNCKSSFNEVDIIDLTVDSPPPSPINSVNGEPVLEDREVIRSSEEYQVETGSELNCDLDNPFDLSIICSEKNYLENWIPESPPLFMGIINSKETLNSDPNIFRVNDTGYSNKKREMVGDFDIKVDKLGSTVETDHFLSPGLGYFDEIKENRNPVENSDTGEKIPGKYSKYDNLSIENVETFTKRKRSLSLEINESAQDHSITTDKASKRGLGQNSSSIPEWVKEFDADLINELKNYVNFVE